MGDFCICRGAGLAGEALLIIGNSFSCGVGSASHGARDSHCCAVTLNRGFRISTNRDGITSRLLALHKMAKGSNGCGNLCHGLRCSLALAIAKPNCRAPNNNNSPAALSMRYIIIPFKCIDRSIRVWSSFVGVRGPQSLGTKSF